MTRMLHARLRKLEATRSPAPGIVPIWAWGKTDEQVEAEKAELVRSGRASPSDHFMVFTSMSDEIARTRGWA